MARPFKSIAYVCLFIGAVFLFKRYVWWWEINWGSAALCVPLGYICQLWDRHRPRPKMKGAIIVTDAQQRDLLRLYHTHLHTVTSYDWPKGRAIELRTGVALEMAGLVEWANQYSANRYRRWRITAEGIRVAEEIRKEMTRRETERPV